MISNVLLIGSTGLIGSRLLELFINDQTIKQVTVLSRRPLDIPHQKVSVRVVDFTNLEQFEKNIEKGDAIFCAIGTTMSKVKGDKDLYRKIDYDIPVNAAKFGVKKGFRYFAIVSSVGANVTSSNFYLKLKGEVEQSLQKVAFEGLHIFQPSLLVGNRSESRPMEKFVQFVMPPLSSLMIGGALKYRPIRAELVASSMLNVIRNEIRGVHRYTFREIMQLKS